MYDLNQYAKDQSSLTRKIHQAEQQHLAELALKNSNMPSHNSIHMGHRMMMTILVVVGFILFLLLVPQTTNAQDKSDPGNADAFYDQMIAFRLGYYYYVTGEYERAVDYYNQAITGIPESILARMNDFRCIYWYLGDAQLKAGNADAALKNYQHYLELVGDEANTVTIDFVQTLKENIASGEVVLEPL